MCNCTFAPIFLSIVRLCILSSVFLSDFAPHLLPLFPYFNDDFEQNTIDKRWGAKSLKEKRGCNIAQLAKDRGKSAIKPNKYLINIIYQSFSFTTPILLTFFFNQYYLPIFLIYYSYLVKLFFLRKKLKHQL